MNVERIETYIAPVRKSVRVARDAAGAFDLFTAGIHRWWPLGQYSISQARARSCVVEGRVGGELYEVRDDGERCPWGRVLVWDPPRRLVMTWHPGRAPGDAQEIEVRFSPAGDGTLVELEHRNWQALGEGAAQVRDRYDGGWNEVIGTYAEVANRPDLRPEGGIQ
jgi:uncharacterized protein YndB with AHSA1/START domain